ncbi:MAG TPA: RNA polymerase factor sigma-54 [Spirochaetota bacterium]
MALSLNTQLKQAQRLTMTQSLRQQIEMLQLSALELVEAINVELESNPVLELDEGSDLSDHVSLDDSLSSGLERELSHDISDEYSPSADFDDSATFDGDEDRKRQFIENAVANIESLADHILNQARLLPLRTNEFQLVEKVVTSFDEHGLFTLDRDLFAQENAVSVDDLLKAIAVIQSCDPVGCGSSSVREALFVQAKNLFPDDILLHSIINDYFSLLSGLMYEKIARALSVSIEEIHEKSRIIQTLNPYPGREYAGSAIRFIVPDVEVRMEDGDVLIVFNDEYTPRLRVSAMYEKMLAKKDIDKKLKEYIKDKLGSAKQLMRNIQGRRETIEKVVRAVMQHQGAFLEKGPGHLKPLTYAQIAEIAKCHESTVSRVSSNKFMRCQWGTFELRYFFASKVGTGSDERSSDEALSLIRDIVAREKSESPLSDDEIAEYLRGAGVNVARRTIAKYRDILHIPSSNKRKRLNLLKAEDGEL